MNLTRQFTFAGTLAAAMAAVAVPAVPSVDTVTMAQPGPTRLVNIDYTLSGADAVITLDIQTNANTSAGADDPGWTSIGGEAIGNATGDVWKKVTNDGTTHHIKWRPDLSWPDHIIANGGARAVVTAWSLDNTPNYMVVDISAGAQANSQKYYTSTNFLPGGLLGNTDYRTSRLVMRKIMAKDVTWTMGSTPMEVGFNGTRDKTHLVTLTNNYYIGVFEITQTQWALIKSDNKFPSGFSNTTDRAMRPVESVSYNEIRLASSFSLSGDSTLLPTYSWPRDPNPASFLGLLYDRTGIRFDLPSAAQWEFAARAGNGDTKWGDGTIISGMYRDNGIAALGRYQYNGGKIIGSSSTTNPDCSCGATNGTAIVGSYKPNDWGLYDMHGNVSEWCLDWYVEDIVAVGHDGGVNIDPSDPAAALFGTATAYRVTRGGHWGREAYLGRSGMRSYANPAIHEVQSNSHQYGFRVVCTAGLQ